MIQLDKTHLAQIIEVAKLTWNDTYSKILSNEQLTYMLSEIYTEKSLMHQMQEGQVFFGFFENKRLISFASVSPVNELKHKLNKLYLLTEFQGKGFGKSMISFVSEYIKKRGANTLTLNVNRNNPAVDFYKSNGFEIIQEIDIPFGPYWMNDYEMLKEI